MNQKENFDESQIPEPKLEDLPAEEPKGEWQDSGEVQPEDDEEDDA